MAVVFNNEHLTEEEAIAVEKLLKERMIAMYTDIIQYDMEQTLAKLGLEETKRIMRKLTHSLNDI